MGEEGQKVSISWYKINPRDVEKQNKVGMLIVFRGFPSGSAVKNPLAMQGMLEMLVLLLIQEDPLEEGMATHSSILVWKIPWTEEPGGL